MAALIPDAIDRPKRNSDAVRAKAIDKLYPEVLEWREEPDDGTLHEQLMKATAWEGDGYSIAKSLESEGWSPDAALVRILEDYAWRLDQAHREAVAAWVKECDVKPPLAVGTAVKAKWGHGEITGTITRIHESQAEYTVTRAGDKDGYGAIVAYENTTPAVGPPSAESAGAPCTGAMPKRGRVTGPE